MQTKKGIVLVGLFILFQAFFPAYAAKPTVAFAASPKTIASGGSSTLTWTTTGATTASINQGIGSVPVNGSLSVSPTVTTTYTITVRNASGQKATASAKVTVTQAPPEATFTASPDYLLLGESSTLSWTTSNATSVYIDNGIGSVALNGSEIVTPGESTLYTLTATGAGGTVIAEVEVIVNTTPAPVVTLTAAPQTIFPGEAALLIWQAQNADSVSIDNGIGDVAAAGSVQVTPAVTTTYTITATNAGGTSTASATITVDDTLMPSAAIHSTAEIITAGQSAFLNWASLHALSASIDNGIGSVSPSGSLSITPAQTTTYTLSAANQNGTASAQVKIVVMPSPNCFAYVPNSSDDTVSIINTIYAGSVVKTLAVGDQPRGSVVSPDGTRVYIGNSSSHSISVVDTGSNTVVSTIAVGGAPKYLALHPGGGILYATLETASGFAVTAINIVTGQVLKELNFIDYLGGIAVHPDGSRLYAALYGASKVLVIDTASNEIVSEIPLRTPIALAVSPDGSRLYAILEYSGYSDNVSVVDTATQAVVSSVRVALPNGVSASLFALGLLPDGSKLYVTISDNNGVSVINTSTFIVTRAEAFAGYSPKCLAAHPDGSKVFVLFTNSSKLVYYYSYGDYYGGWVDIGTYPHAYGQFVGYMARTAAGKVSQNAVGVAGVTLTITGEGVTRTAVTDADGNFITALKDGTYTITPSKNDLVFSPQSKEITVEQNLTGVDFVVIDPAVAPTVSLSASPAEITAGNMATLSWTSTNTATAAIDNGVGAVPVSGSVTVTPDATTTYTITVSNTVLTATATALVTVSSPPPTVIISASPATIVSGGSSTLTWTTANAVTAEINNGVGSVPVNGSAIVSPTATTTYTITATGAGGSASSSVQVTMEEPPPTITFSAAPEFIPPGGSSTLTWTTTGAESASIDNGIGAVGLSGSLAVSPTSETTYTLSATGPSGTSTASVTIKMLEATLRSVWNDMKTAMQSGNITQTSSYFCEQTRDKYSGIFTAIADQLPQIALEMRDIEPVYYEEYGAKFRIKRTEEIEGVTYDITYYIYFVQEEDGSWKILNY